MWMIGDGPDLVSQGFNFICLTEPIMFLESKLGLLNADIKGQGKAQQETMVLPYLNWI